MSGEAELISEASIHSSMLLIGSTTDLGALRTHNAVQARQAQVVDATRRLLQSETMVNMLQEAGVELPSLEDLTMGRRRGAAPHGRGDWRSTLNKAHGHQQAAAGAATEPGAAGDAAAGGSAEDAAAAAAAEQTEAPTGSPPKSPRRKQDQRGGWRRHIPRDGSEDIERNPVIRRLKKLRHKVLFGKIGERAYERYKATLRANLTWRDILRPNLSVAKRAGHNLPGFSRWLDRAITEEQKWEVRNEAARVIQNAWRAFKRFRIESVMQHVRNYEMGNYEWSDVSSDSSSESSSSESSSEEDEGKKKKKGKLKRSKSAKRLEGTASKRAVLAAVAGAMDEETMGDAVIAGAPKRLARRRRKKKKAQGDGEGSDGGEGGEGAEEGDGVAGPGAEGEEGESPPGTGKGRRRGRKGRKGAEGGEEEGATGEEAAAEEAAAGAAPEGDAPAEEDSGAALLKRSKSARRRKGAKSRPPSPPPEESVSVDLPDIAAFLATMEANEARRSSRQAQTPQTPIPEPPQTQSQLSLPDSPESVPKGKKGKKGKKGDKAAVEEEAEGAGAAEAAAKLEPAASGTAPEVAPVPPADASATTTASGAAGGRSGDGSIAAAPPSGEQLVFTPSAGIAALSAAASMETPDPVVRDFLIGETPRSLISAVDTAEDDFTGFSTGDGAVSGGNTERSAAGGEGGGKGGRRRKKRSKRRSDAVPKRTSEAGPSGSATSNYRKRLTSDAPDWSKVGHSVALFDATTDTEKRAAILARLARDAGPAWKPTGVIAEWMHMSQELYEGDDPDKRAAAMAKVAAVVAAAGHPLWRPGGAAIHQAFSSSRSLYDGDDPHKRAEAMVRAAESSPPGHPSWRPAGASHGFTADAYDRGLYEAPPPPAPKQKWDYKDMPPWKPPGVPRVDYYNYYRGSSSSSGSGSEESSSEAPTAREGETPEQAALRRAAERAEKRAKREERRAARRAAVAGEGSGGSVNNRYNTRKPWRFAYAVDEEPPPAGNEPASARYEHVTRDDKGGPRPWKYTVIPEQNKNVPYNIWGPYVDPSRHRSPRIGPWQGSRDGAPDGSDSSPRTRRFRPLSARVVRPEQSSGNVTTASNDITSLPAGEGSGNAGPDGPGSPARPARIARLLRRNLSMSQLEMRIPVLRRAMSARSRINVAPAPYGGIPSHIVLSPEAAAALAIEASMASAASVASGRSGGAPAPAGSPTLAVIPLVLPLPAPSIPSQRAEGSSPSLLHSLSVKGRTAIPPTVRASIITVPQSPMPVPSAAMATAAAGPAAAPTTTAAAPEASMAASSAPSAGASAEPSAISAASAAAADDGAADDAGSPQPPERQSSRSLSRAVSFATEPSRAMTEPSQVALTDSTNASPRPPEVEMEDGEDGGASMPDLSGPLAVLAGAIAMGAGVLMSTVSAPSTQQGDSASELEVERSATQVAAAAAAVEAAVEAVAAVLSAEVSAGLPGPPPLLPREALEEQQQRVPPLPPPQQEPSSVSQMGTFSSQRTLTEEGVLVPQSALPSTGELPPASVPPFHASPRFQPLHQSTRPLHQSPRHPQQQTAAGASEQCDEEDDSPAWLYATPSFAPADPRQLYGSVSRRHLRGRRSAVGDDDMYGTGRSTQGRRERERTPLHPPALSDPADPAPKLKRICSARGVGAFTSSGIQPYPLDPELLKCLPSHLVSAQGRARSAPGSPRTFLTGEVSVATAGTAATVATAVTSNSGHASDSEGAGLSTLRGGEPSGQLPYSYVYGYSPPGTAMTVGKGESLGRDDLPPLPSILQDPRAKDFLAMRGNKMLAQRRLAAKGAAQPDPRSMYELLFLGRRVEQHRQQQYVAGTLAPGNSAAASTLGSAAGSAAATLQRRTATGMGVGTAGGGGGPGLAALADAHLKAEAQLFPEPPTSRLHTAYAGEALSSTWGRTTRPHTSMDEQSFEAQAWSGGPSAVTTAALQAAVASMAAAWGAAGPASAQQWAHMAQPLQPLSSHHALPPVRAVGTPLQPPASGLFGTQPLVGSAQGSQTGFMAVPAHAGSRPSANDPLRRTVPSTAPAAAGRALSPSKAAATTTGTAAVHGSVPYTQYTFSVASRPEERALLAHENQPPTHGSLRPGSGRLAFVSSSDAAPSNPALPPDAAPESPAGQGYMRQGSTIDMQPVQHALQPSLNRHVPGRAGSRASSRAGSISSPAERGVAALMQGTEEAAAGGAVGTALEVGRSASISMLPPISQQPPGAPVQPLQAQTSLSSQPVKPPSPMERTLSENHGASTVPADQPSAGPTRLPAVGQRRSGRQPPVSPDGEPRAGSMSPQRRRQKGQLRMGRAPLGAPLALRLPERPPGAAAS